MIAYHWLKEDMTSEYGSGKPWKIGDKRTIRGSIELCRRGYHSSPTPFDGLEYAPGPVLCLVEVSRPVESDTTKQVSHTRKLLAYVNVRRELRQFVIDCVTRALMKEREAEREPSPRSFAAVQAAQDYLNELISTEELGMARSATSAVWVTRVTRAAWAAWAASATEATSAVWAASAAWAAEENKWQSVHFNELVTCKLNEVTRV